MTIAHDRLGFVSLPLPDITYVSAVSFKLGDRTVARVELGNDVSVHLEDPAKARDLAAAFTRAAELLETAQAEAGTQDGVA